MWLMNQLKTLFEVLGAEEMKEVPIEWSDFKHWAETCFRVGQQIGQFARVS